MYYLTYVRYVGKNQDENIDAHRIAIRSSPAISSETGEPAIEGWCYAVGDWSIVAHGKYGSIESARAGMFSIFGPTRDAGRDGKSFEINPDMNELEAYKEGRFVPMRWEEMEKYLEGFVSKDIQLDCSNTDLLELAHNYEINANKDGYTLGKYSLVYVRELHGMALAEKSGDTESMQSILWSRTLRNKKLGITSE